MEKMANLFDIMKWGAGSGVVGIISKNNLLNPAPPTNFFSKPT